MESTTLKTLFISALLLFQSFAFSAETIDIATCIEQRTQQYPMNGYEQIVVFAPYRTGCTYVYNILRFLFESEEMKYPPFREDVPPGQKVCKTHLPQLPKKGTAIVFTTRNPLHSCFSLYRVLSATTPLSEADLEVITANQVGFYIASLPFLSNNPDCLTLKYEEFVDTIDNIFTNIERFFSIAIAEADKQLLRKALDKDNVLANIEHLAIFDHEDPHTRFHGDHIDQGKMPPEEREWAQNKILRELEKFKSIIQACGYSNIFNN